MYCTSLNAVFYEYISLMLWLCHINLNMMYRTQLIAGDVGPHQNVVISRARNDRKRCKFSL